MHKSMSVRSLRSDSSSLEDDQRVQAYREKYQKQFETYEGLIRFNFQQYGASLIIQRWFRSWRHVRKSAWHKKYRKMKIKYQQQKLFLRAIVKCRSLRFAQEDLQDPFKCKLAAALIVTRIVRGFIGRRRLKIFLTNTALSHNMQIRTATKIQSIARMYIKQVQCYPIGLRYRLLQRKMHRAAFSTATATHDYPTDFDCHHRRTTLLYRTTQLGTVHDLDEMDTMAALVQRNIRKLIAKGKYRKLFQAHKQKLATKLQRWIVRFVWKKKMARAMGHLRPFLHRIALAKRRVNNAAKQLQAMLRSYVRRKKLREILHVRRYCARKLAQWGWKRLKQRRKRQVLQANRSKHEMQAAGMAIYKQSELFWYTRYLWQGLKRTKQAEKQEHELQRIFASMTLANAVEHAKIVKLLRDCKGLFNNNFNANTIELQFTKLKQGSERRIEYSRFLDLLANLAVIRFLELDPTKTLFDDIAALKPSNPHAPAPALDPLKQKVIAFSFGSLHGRAALISKFVDTFIFAIPDFDKVLHYLGKKAAKELKEDVLHQAVLVLQLFVKNRLFIKKTRLQLAAIKFKKIEQRIYKAANVIQSVVKGFLGRRLITKMAQNLYSKFVDGETEREYWFNSRTGSSFWVKPKLLGRFDCGTAVRMPPPDEMFSVQCSNCELMHATCFCEQCNAPMCTPCYGTLHRTGTRQAHVHMLIDNCIQCEFQIGSRFCNSCNDLFCDSCYNYMHKSGRLRFHAYERYCAACDSCNVRSARWKEHGQVMTTSSTSVSVRFPGNKSSKSRSSFSKSITSTRYKITMWCTVCYKQEFQADPVERKMIHDDPPQTALEKVIYYGRAVKKHLEQNELNKAQAAIEKSFQMRQLEIEKKRQHKACLLIQRVYRGYKVRVRIFDFVKQRKELFLLRKQEDSVRNSLLYKFKAMLGFKLLLDSDTPLERVKKTYPWYMHHIVAACIENNWTEACRLLVEHEAHLAKTKLKQKPTMTSYIQAEIALYYARRAHDKACKQYTQRAAMVDGAVISYYNAEASGAYPEDKLRRLKAGMSKLERLLQKDDDKKRAMEDALQVAEDRVVDILGPRGLQLLVINRRKHGVPMPFRVRMQNNSRLALVQYPLDGDDSSKQNSNSFRQNSNPSEMGGMTLDQYMSKENSEAPGKWKAKLKAGDRIYIDGVLFTIQASPVKRPSSRQPSREGSSRSRKRASSVASEDTSDEPSTSSKKVSSKIATSSREVSSRTDFSDTAGDRSARSASSAPEVVTEDHMLLDRPWLLDDAAQIEVFKVVPRIFYMQPVYGLRRMLLKTYVMQKLVAILAINQHKNSGFYSKLSALFDDDSSTHSMLQRWSVQATERKQAWMRLSYRQMEMSYDFSLRKRVGRVLWGSLGAVGAVGKMLVNIVKIFNSGAEETPFEYWQRSLEKETVQVELDLGGNDAATRIGDIVLDLKAPCEIMREYIHRAFRAKLNESIGESFLFALVDEESNKTIILPREDEYRTYAKVYAVQKVDARTFMSSLTVLLIKDRARGRVFIPEFTSKPGEDGEEEEEKVDEEEVEMQRLLKKS